MEKAANAPPHFCEPMRLENQKPDDQQPEQHGAYGREEDRQLAAMGQQGDTQLEQFWHHGHEDRTQNAAQYGAHAADDDGGEEEDRHRQRKALGRDDPEKVGPQAASDAGVERRKTKRQQLVAQQWNAQHLGRDVAVTDGNEGSANPGAKQIGGTEQHQYHGGNDHPVEAKRGIQQDPKKCCRWNGETAGATRESAIGKEEMRDE